MVFRVENLDRVRELPALPLALSETDVAKAAADRTARAATVGAESRRTVVPYRTDAAENTPPTFVLSREGQGEKADVHLSWDDEGLRFRVAVSDPLSPWKNASTDATTLFKGGDAVDIRLRPNASGAAEAAPGDVRFLFAPFQGSAYALIMREKAPGAPADARRVYSSPVSTVVFDSVGPAPKTIRFAVDASVEGYVLTGTIPWGELGFDAAPAAGTVLRGDVGLLCSDAAGRLTSARMFRYSHGGNLVSDLPAEARLSPAQWGEFLLEKNTP